MATFLQAEQEWRANYKSFLEPIPKIPKAQETGDEGKNSSSLLTITCTIRLMIIASPKF